MKNIEKELYKLAEQEVNKKLEEERIKTEKAIKSDIEKVKIVLEMIENKMLYKIDENKVSGHQFILITKEIFFDDYTRKPEYDWKKGIELKEYDSWKEKYNFEIKVNGIWYYHIGEIISKYKELLNEQYERVRKLNSRLEELESETNKLINQEKNIKGFIENYNEVKNQIESKGE